MQMISLSDIDDHAFTKALTHKGSFAKLCSALGLKYSAYMRKAIRKRASSLGIDVSDILVSQSRFSDKSALAKAVTGAKSYSDVLRNLGIIPRGGNSATLKKYLALFKIEISHLVDGQAHGAGKCREVVSRNRRPLAELLVINSPASRGTVKRGILKEGLLPYKCAKCENIGEWNGAPLTLALEHKNGVGNDHRLENLEFLCPNCHSQTPTFAGRKTKKGPVSQEEVRRARRQERENRLKLGLPKPKRDNDAQKTKWLENQGPRLAALRAANIDFTKYGWASRAGRVINLSPQKVTAWLKKVDPELYATCMLRKPPAKRLGRPAANDATAAPAHRVA